MLVQVTVAGRRYFGEEVGRCGCSDGCFENWILVMSYSVCSVES